MDSLSMNSINTETKSTSMDIRQALSKVPEVTVFFWIIKVLCTTVGETASDFLNVNLNFGLTGTSILAGILLAVALWFQFRSKKYVPGLYWVTVVLISVFGTLVTDNLTDAIGVPLEVSTIVFSVLLAITFALWYRSEKTLSIHSIFTKRREVFYWLTILFTFALGTAAGDLMAEQLGLGYVVTGLIIASLIILFAIAWRWRLNSILAFWMIYIMTRPLGASIGDYLSQPQKYGGLGLGATMTSVIFLLAIFVTVLYLSYTKRDQVTNAPAEEQKDEEQTGGLIQTVVVIALLVIAGLIGYNWRQSVLRAAVATSGATSTSGSSLIQHQGPLGDLSTFQTITQDTLDLVNAGKLADATTRVADLEHEWDTAEARLKPMNSMAWTEMDNGIDKVLRQLRAVNPNADGCKAALEALLAIIKADQ